jgi:hypothetical protein
MGIPTCGRIHVERPPFDRHMAEQPCQTVRKEMLYAVCLAALTAMLRSRVLLFSMLVRTGLKPVK